jgi:hypothetical protein
MFTGTATGPNSAPDSLTPKYVNLVRFPEQVPLEGAVGCSEGDVPALVLVVASPELSGKHCA